MKAVVVYESMYGNTHLIANAIADGLRETGEAVAVPVHNAQRTLLDEADLIVVGGPTHAHGMTRAGTRRSAIAAAAKPDIDLTIDLDAEGPGLREWFAGLEHLTARGGVRYAHRCTCGPHGTGIKGDRTEPPSARMHPDR